MKRRARGPILLATAVGLFFMLLACGCAFALDPNLDVSQYAHTSWKIREGFVKGAISRIAQTPDGCLWLGTEFGLLRFDGVRALLWQPPGNERLPSSNIRELLVANDGTLWINTLKGVVSWKNGELTQHPEVDGLPIGLVEDREQTVWVGTFQAANAKLCAIRNGKVECYGAGAFGSVARPLYQDHKGNLWVSSQTGLWRWAPGAPERYAFPQGVTSVNASIEDDSGILLLATNNGLKQFVGGRIENYSLPGVTGRLTALTFLRSHDGSLWIGTIKGLLHMRQGKGDRFGMVDGLSGDLVGAIFEDREGSVWVATSDGLDRFREYSIPTISRNQGLSTSIVGSVQATPDGSIWMGTVEELNRWVKGHMIVYRSRGASSQIRPRDDAGLNLNGVATEIANSGIVGDLRCLGLDDSGRLWVSTNEGFFHFEHGRFIQVPLVPAGFVFSIAGDANDGLWILESEHLFHSYPNKGVQEIPWAQFGPKTGRAMLPDRESGAVWVGFYEGGIAYVKDDKVVRTYSAAAGLGAGRVTQVRLGPNSGLWASTESGLSRIKDGRVATLTSKSGLPCDEVHWSMEDDDHAVWLYMPCGLVRIARSELDAWINDSKYVLRTTVFDNSDGVRSVGVFGAAGPHVTKSPDGRIWFVPRDGVSVIDPQHLPFNNLPPPVHVEQIVANHKSYAVSSDANENLRLPALIGNLQIDYTALSLVAPEKVLFRYKLEGWDRDWQDAGTRRQAFYGSLPPRNYTFRVRASNNSGVWNEGGASLQFAVLPAVYQTDWFRGLCVIGFLGLLWGAFQLRVQQLQRQFNIGLEARVNERTRIARELHDTLLQNFHGLMFQLQAVRNLMSRRPEEAMQSLDDAINETEKALSESRDAIQGLRSEPIAKGDLAELLVASSQDLAQVENRNHQPPVFDLIQEGDRKTLSATTKNEVCRIAIEILRNAYRHAHARRIEAEVRYGEHVLRVRIRDDGKGIDPKVLRDGGSAGHWGLRGIRERAARIGGQLDFWSEAGAGTEVQLTVPASVAYEISRQGVGSRLLRRVRKNA